MQLLFTDQRYEPPYKKMGTRNSLVVLILPCISFLEMSIHLHYKREKKNIKIQLVDFSRHNQHIA